MKDEVDVLCASVQRGDSRAVISRILKRSAPGINQKITSLGGILAIRGYYIGRWAKEAA